REGKDDRGQVRRVRDRGVGEAPPPGPRPQDDECYRVVPYEGSRPRPRPRVARLPDHEREEKRSAEDEREDGALQVMEAAHERGGRPPPRADEGGDDREGQRPRQWGEGEAEDGIERLLPREAARAKEIDEGDGQDGGDGVQRAATQKASHRRLAQAQ